MFISPVIGDLLFDGYYAGDVATEIITTAAVHDTGQNL
jgi:hypothetical protein